MAYSEACSPPKRIWQWLSFPMSKNIMYGIIHGSLSVHSLVTTITWPLHTGERLLLPIPSHWPLPHRLAKTNTSSSGQRCGLGAWGSHRNQVGAETAQLSQTMTQAPFQKPHQLRLGQLPAASLVMLSVHRDQLGQQGQSRWKKRDGRDESRESRQISRREWRWHRPGIKLEENSAYSRVGSRSRLSQPVKKISPQIPKRFFKRRI